jgi:hypothetical protein
MTASKGKSSSTDPPSPSASFYDLSDDEEGEYNTIAHSKVGKGVKLLFSKSKVRYSAAASPSINLELSANMITGLRAPHPFRQRQHSRFHSAHPTEDLSAVTDFTQTYAYQFSILLSSSLGSRVLSRPK